MGERTTICTLGILNHPTSINRRNPFFFTLAYGTEAIIPLEVGLPTFRTMQVEGGGNNEALDFADKKRKMAIIRLAEYQ